MHTSRWLTALRRPSMLPAAQNNPLLGLGQLLLRQQQPQHPIAKPAAVTFVRNFRVRPRRNKNRPPRKLPFKGHMEQMNYVCYQLAMDVIRKDRTEIAEKIKEGRKRIERVKTWMAESTDDDKSMYKMKLISLRKALNDLLIRYDINSPRARYNYLKGTGSMERPVHRYLAREDFLSMRQKILKQRIDQMYMVPDVIPHMDPVADVRLRFRGSECDPGQFVRSKMSMTPPSVKVIPYEKKDRLCTIAVVDPDVPDIERDSYTYRLHWLVSNIEINHVKTQAIGLGARGVTTLSPYLPPYVHRGAPYHRYCLMVFDQKERIEKSETPIERDGFNMRSFMRKNDLSPLTAFMWRGKWDKYTKRLMQDNNIEGWNLRFVRRNH